MLFLKSVLTVPVQITGSEVPAASLWFLFRAFMGGTDSLVDGVKLFRREQFLLAKGASENLDVRQYNVLNLKVNVNLN